VWKGEGVREGEEGMRSGKEREQHSDTYRYEDRWKGKEIGA